MKYLHTEAIGMNMKVLMNRLGYHEQQSPRTGTVSYSRRLGGMPYPRFHLYVDPAQGGLLFKLHLDAKQPSYQGQTAHSGEYEGEEVAAELERIKQYLAAQG